MGEPLPGARPAVLSASTVLDLDEYLRFRHVFRSLYGFELSWERFGRLLTRLAEVASAVQTDLSVFRALLRSLAAAG